jgi:hypothetical protein|eukprot:COSAG02_NODE_10445_length_1939_cov_2.107609_1_plen_139_part_00
MHNYVWSRYSNLLRHFHDVAKSDDTAAAAYEASVNAESASASPADPPQRQLPWNLRKYATLVFTMAVVTSFLETLFSLMGFQKGKGRAHTSDDVVLANIQVKQGYKPVDSDCRVGFEPLNFSDDKALNDKLGWKRHDR